jgi:hypothetical protein
MEHSGAEAFAVPGTRSPYQSSAKLVVVSCQLGFERLHHLQTAMREGRTI